MGQSWQDIQTHPMLENLIFAALMTYYLAVAGALCTNISRGHQCLDHCRGPSFPRGSNIPKQGCSDRQAKECSTWTWHTLPCCSQHPGRKMSHTVKGHYSQVLELRFESDYDSWLCVNLTGLWDVAVCLNSGPTP
jgi:hypothetical protein